MNPVMFPLAIGLQELVTIVFVVIGLLSVIGQALAKAREQKGGPRRQVPRPQPPPGGARPKRPAKLEDEIGAFLRRAAEGRAAPAKPAPRAGQPGGAAPLPRRPVQPRPGPRRPAPARTVEIPIAAEIVEPVAHPVGGPLEAGVAKDLDTREFQRRAGQLGKQSRRATKKVQRRLHEKSGHQLGKPAVQTGQKTKPKKRLVTVPSIPATAAAGFAVMLRDVNDTREAIVLNEIFTRPVDRW